jgi:hypothetical protein
MLTALLIAEIAIAEIAHEQNRIYCESIGDDSQPLWMEAPDWQKESALNGVNAIADGVITGPEGSHKNWLAEKVKEGWVYGPEKDPEAKEHPCCVPFEELSEEMQFKDILFFDTVTSLINSTRTFKNRLQAETGKDA